MFFTSIQLFLFGLFSRKPSLTLFSPRDNLVMFFSIPVCVFDICLPHGWRGLEANDQVLFIFVSLASATWQFHGWIWVYFLWPYEMLTFFFFFSVPSNFLVIDPFLLLGTCRVIVFFFVLKLPFRSSRKTLFVLLYRSRYISHTLENRDPFTLSVMFSISRNQTASSFRHMILGLQNLLVLFQSVLTI